MIQRALFNQWIFECGILKGYHAVIQNDFVDGLTEQEAQELILESSAHYESQIAKLQELKLRIEECIRNQIRR